MILVDSILARHGMKWELGPYRIVNKHGVVVQKQYFDLRQEVLAAQENIRNQGHQFTKTSSTTSDAI